MEKWNYVLLVFLGFPLGTLMYTLTAQISWNGLQSLSDVSLIYYVYLPALAYIVLLNSGLKLLDDVNTVQKFRLILLGVSICSLIFASLNLLKSLNPGHPVNNGTDWLPTGMIRVYREPPYLTINGVPFTSVLMSFLTAGCSAVFERLLGIWEKHTTITEKTQNFRTLSYIV